VLDSRSVAGLGLGGGASAFARFGLWIKVNQEPSGAGGTGLFYQQRDAAPARRDDDEILLLVLL